MESFFHPQICVNHVIIQTKLDEIRKTTYNLANGGQPQTSLPMEDDLIFFLQMEDNQNILVKRRQPQKKYKIKQH